MSDMQLGGARPRLDPHSPDAGVPTLSALPGAGPLGGGRFLNGQMARRTCWLLMWRGALGHCKVSPWAYGSGCVPGGRLRWEEVISLHSPPRKDTTAADGSLAQMLTQS